MQEIFSICRAIVRGTRRGIPAPEPLWVQSGFVDPSSVVAQGSLDGMLIVFGAEKQTKQMYIPYFMINTLLYKKCCPLNFEN